jgi:aspartyl-tRNA(Asn)/glutamyl-tRNA(Gln) amidotransferase subunit B
MNKVIGLEVHVQLNTRRKVFASASYTFGAKPNSCVSAIGMAHPGALPSVNEACVDKVILLGLALNCRINEHSRFARKNYFYPDLPKGYQMSQAALPICEDGFFDLSMPDGSTRRIGITRIHLEEDAGKLIHDEEPGYSLVDLNRAGTGLAEIVTEPDFRTAEEAAAFLAEIRRLVRYLNVGDGDMEKGNLRCDANISVREHEDAPYGTRAEVKNLNSFSFLEAAINHEASRQQERIAEGEQIIQETRNFDPATGTTSGMRGKEDAEDYRYFPEPDLPPLFLSKEKVEAIRSNMPELPWERRQRYLSLGLDAQQIQTLVEKQDWGDVYDDLLDTNLGPKAAANWLFGPIAVQAKSRDGAIKQLGLVPDVIANIEKLIEAGKVDRQQARGKLFEEMLRAPEADLEAKIKALGLELSKDDDMLLEAVRALEVSHPKEVARYRAGEKKLQGFLMGQLMRSLRGKADPGTLSALIQKEFGKAL